MVFLGMATELGLNADSNTLTGGERYYPSNRAHHARTALYSAQWTD